MKPHVVVDAWYEPFGTVVLSRSRLFPRQLAVLRSVRDLTGDVSRRMCVEIGDSQAILERTAVEALAYRLVKGWAGRVRHR